MLLIDIFCICLLTSPLSCYSASQDPAGQLQQALQVLTVPQEASQINNFSGKKGKNLKMKKNRKEMYKQWTNIRLLWKIKARCIAQSFTNAFNPRLKIEHERHHRGQRLEHRHWSATCKEEEERGVCSMIFTLMEAVKQCPYFTYTQPSVTNAACRSIL